MRIPSINVENRQGLRRAICEAVPRLLVIAGPNGAGKSTLLDALATDPDETGETVYIGPHRDAGRKNVSQKALFGIDISSRSVLAKREIPHFGTDVQGIRSIRRNQQGHR